MNSLTHTYNRIGDSLTFKELCIRFCENLISGNEDECDIEMPDKCFALLVFMILKMIHKNDRWDFYKEKYPEFFPETPDITRILEKFEDLQKCDRLFIIGRYIDEHGDCMHPVGWKGFSESDPIFVIPIVRRWLDSRCRCHREESGKIDFDTPELAQMQLEREMRQNEIIQEEEKDVLEREINCKYFKMTKENDCLIEQCQHPDYPFDCCDRDSCSFFDGLVKEKISKMNQNIKDADDEYKKEKTQKKRGKNRCKFLEKEIEKDRYFCTNKYCESKYCPYKNQPLKQEFCNYFVKIEAERTVVN